MEKVTSLDRMKRENEKRVLRAVHRTPGIYRKQIAAETGLSSQTVTNLVAELLEKKVLLEHALIPASRGRTPVSLTLNYGGIYMMTAEVAVERVEVFLHSLDGTVAASHERKLYGNEDVLQCLKEEIDWVQKSAGAVGPVQALVISVTGVVNEDTGTVVVAKRLHWYHLNLEESLAYLGIPVLVRNDVNLIAAYEKGGGRTDMNFMVVKIDNGIGAAFVLGSQVLKSTNNVVGELGHVTVVSDEVRPCACGKTNCLTRFISMEALEKTYGKSYGELVQDVERRVPEAVELVEKLCSYLAPVLANVILLLDLDRVILCGCTVEHFSTMICHFLDRKIREQLSYWVAFKGLKVHKDISIVQMGSRFWLDYYLAEEKAQLMEEENI